MAPHVLFVSKAIVPPFNDGSKCLVRAVATHLTEHEAVIMTTGEVLRDPDLTRLRHTAVYRSRGGFSPSLAANAGVARHLLFERDARIWHFVMAPSPRTSSIARMLRAVRRVPVVQTLASQPRSFDSMGRLLFGDVIVAQSEWTRAQIQKAARAAGIEVEIEMIPPPIAAVPSPTAAAIESTRTQFGLSGAFPVVLYPGDLEVSHGAELFASLVEPVTRALPGAVFVFACREKTARAPQVKATLAARLPPERVRFVGEVADFPALLAAADVVLFPVDDLWGKVDVPIALLEALALEVPVIALAEGPLLDLQGGARLVPPGAIEPWVEAVVQLVQDPEQRRVTIHQGRDFVLRRHAAAAIAASYERIYARLLE